MNPIEYIRELITELTLALEILYRDPPPATIGSGIKDVREAQARLNHAIDNFIRRIEHDNPNR
jgi:hypothetical protein